MIRTTIVAALSLVLLGAAPAGAGSTRSCGSTPHATTIRATSMSCARARSVSTYWETTGRGHCPSGYSFRNRAGDRLSCRRGSSVVSWQEGGE